MTWVIILCALIAIDAIITLIYIYHLTKANKDTKESLRAVIHYAEVLEDQNNLLRDILNNK